MGIGRLRKTAYSVPAEALYLCVLMGKLVYRRLDQIHRNYGLNLQKKHISKIYIATLPAWLWLASRPGRRICMRPGEYCFAC